VGSKAQGPSVCGHPVGRLDPLQFHSRKDAAGCQALHEPPGSRISPAYAAHGHLRRIFQRQAQLLHKNVFGSGGAAHGCQPAGRGRLAMHLVDERFTLVQGRLPGRVRRHFGVERR
jgi:hypothetical protein